MSDQLGKRGSGFSKNPDRERFLFIAAAGAACSLLIVLLAVITFRPDADANQPAASQPVATPVQPSLAMSTIDLYVPERPVRAGQKLSDVKFKTVVWPRNQVPDGAIRDLSELKEKYAKVPLDPSIPVRQEFISDTPVRVSLPLTPGMRAITIEVDETQALEGFALAGTSVDVTLTYMTEEKKLETRIIVSKARVLSYGGDTTEAGQRQPNSIRPTAARTITLEVNANDALSMQTAKQLGRIGLIMRTADDDKAPETDSINQNKILDPGAKTADGTVSCKSGTMKIGGKEYIVPCDGKGMIPVEGDASK